MKKLTKKILSAFLALAMVLGVAGSAFVSKAQDATKTTVVVHKLELNNLENWPKQPGPNGKIVGADGTTEYDGSEIGNIEAYFGQGAKPLSGVEFLYWKITKEQYDFMMKNPADYKTVEKVEAFFGEVEGDKAFNATDGAGEKAKATKLSKVTGEQGTFEVQLDDGYYWFVENFGSKLDGDNAGKTLSKAAAVPFGLALPIYKSDGNRFSETDKLHVYPKNTLADKPKTDKNFDNGADREVDDIKLDDNQRDKGSRNVFAGQVVPYQVVTQIPAGAEYKTAKWDDQMTEGLTYTKGSLEIHVKDVKLEAGDYQLEETDRGFNVKLTDNGLAKINNQNEVVKVKLTYTATVNEKAIVDIPEANDVTFHYGNNPSHGNTPKPNKPNPADSSITVEKKWAEGGFPDGVTVRMQLVNAQTGDKVGNEVELTKDQPTHKWTNLDKDTEYKVEEIWNGYTPEYIISTEPGKTEVKNHKDDNPEPQNPSEPKVVTGGKRFQKVDELTKAGLEGAEFNVTKTENGVVKYLAKKAAAQAQLDQQAYVTAEKAYKDAVKAGNADTTELKKARDEAYKAVNTQWEWIDEGQKDNAFVLRSGTDGYFKVTGLSYGNYNLVEKTAPTGYAKISEPVQFTVAANSHEATTLTVDKLSDDGLKMVENKKITIPETGGMGTVIFTVVGIAIMGGAIFAMKRRSQEQ